MNPAPDRLGFASASACAGTSAPRHLGTGSPNPHREALWPAGLRRAACDMRVVIHIFREEASSAALDCYLSLGGRARRSCVDDVNRSGPLIIALADQLELTHWRR